MLPHEKIKSYVDSVCEQIRWKKAHTRVYEELENHIIDQRDSLMEQGLDEETATDKAISNTGDAETIGAQFDITHRPKPQWGMLLSTVALLSIGILVKLFVFRDWIEANALYTQLVFIGIGLAGMFVAYFADFSFIGKYPKLIYLSIIIFSMIVYYFSPIESGRVFYADYAVLLFPLAYAAAIYAAKSKRYIGIILCILAFVVPGYIALTVPFLSGFLLFAIFGSIMLSIAIHKKWFGSIKRRYGYLTLIVPGVSFIVLLFMNINDYQRNRIETFFGLRFGQTPDNSLNFMTRELLSGANFFGQGNLTEQFMLSPLESYHPFGHFIYTDLLLTAIIALLGWAAFSVVICAILFFIVKGFILSFKQKSVLGFFVSFSIMMTFSIQAVGYVIYNLGFQLFAPISLPLISFGSLATIVNLVLIGFMLSVFRTGDVVSDGDPLDTKTKKQVHQLG